MSTQIKHKRPKYSLEFKKDAANLVIENGYIHEHEMGHSAFLLPEV